MDALTPSEHHDPIWLKVEAYLRQRRDKAVSRLIAKEDPEARGVIKEFDFILKPPADPAHGNF